MGRKHNYTRNRFFLALVLCASSGAVFGVTKDTVDLTSTWVGPFVIAVFSLAYLLVIGEEFLHLRKSKPVMVAAGLIWAAIAVVYASHGDTTTAADAVRHNLLEYVELFLFLLAAMTYVRALEDRQIFNKLRSWLASLGMSLRAMFWLTGLLAFVISPFADNLTTALLVGAVVTAIGVGQPAFVAVSCVNVVVAANAGGAFSPFGDITTLMVWQKGLVPFADFFQLFLPSLLNWLVPALLMSLSIPSIKSKPIKEVVALRRGAWGVVMLFTCTVIGSIFLHSFLHLPPVMGMMTGLGILKLFGYWLQRSNRLANGSGDVRPETVRSDLADDDCFDTFSFIASAEWDTLMFFYGVILCVGGLGTVGYLTLLSHALYIGLGATWANVLVGAMSALIDNVPIMLAVLTMKPVMGVDQWLLVTLTAGVGGSLLSVGSAAGVALMGQARGAYTFLSHLKWTWAITLGYCASIACHVWLSSMH